ncbi:ATP-binding cassette domain-containing protein [Paenibacillus thiaminolyticus]|nr:ATP-binding cassette domain-containing protein [Paenibacillus thiaminolyticus]
MQGISFSINEGEIVGFIGPNGAGKSTTIKCLSGILVPTSGLIQVNGINPFKNRNKNAKQIGVVFGQKTSLWWDVPVIESFKLLRDIYAVPDEKFRKNLSLFDDILEISSFQSTPVRQLSLGQRMRVDLAAALLHDPKILYLDEPTIGLDVAVKEKLRYFIKQINEYKKTTVLLTTHDMDDVEKMSDRLIIIDKGAIIHEGSISNTISKFSPDTILNVEFSQYMERKISLNSPCTEIQENGNNCIIKFDREKVSGAKLIAELVAKYEVKDISIKEPDIEEIVREIYNRSKNSLSAVSGEII